MWHYGRFWFWWKSAFLRFQHNCLQGTGSNSSWNNTFLLVSLLYVTTSSFILSKPVWSEIDSTDQVELNSNVVEEVSLVNIEEFMWIGYDLTNRFWTDDVDKLHYHLFFIFTDKIFSKNSTNESSTMFKYLMFSLCCWMALGRSIKIYKLHYWLNEWDFWTR